MEEYGTNYRRIWSCFCFDIGWNFCNRSAKNHIVHVIGGEMKGVIYEYSDAVVAIVGAIGLLQLLTTFFVDESGVMAKFIVLVLQGGT